MAALDIPQRTADTPAGREYTRRERAIREMLYDLFAAIEMHREQFDGAGRTNWGLVGDLGEIEAQLTEVKNFINNKE